MISEVPERRQEESQSDHNCREKSPLSVVLLTSLSLTRTHPGSLSPPLVALPGGRRGRRHLLQRGWGYSWGCFLCVSGEKALPRESGPETLRPPRREVTSKKSLHELRFKDHPAGKSLLRSHFVSSGDLSTKYMEGRGGH